MTVETALKLSEVPSSQSLLSGGLIRQAAGKVPDVVSGKYAVSVFSIPSGRIDTVVVEESGESKGAACPAH